MTNLYDLNCYDFDLPEASIAQQAIEPRDHARLLHVKDGTLGHFHVYDLPELLRPDDVLVINNTRVIPARLYGMRDMVRVEVMLHQDRQDGTWAAFARPGKRLAVGQIIAFAPNFSATILEKRDGGEIILTFSAQGAEFMQNLIEYGEPPLPPYIHRAQGTAKAERDRYQTVYAQQDGAVAAPTAGLHFTPDLLHRLKERGISIETVTLHVGAGTFLPVKVDDIRQHKMHAEYGVLSAETAERLNAAKQAGRRIVAVGTTSLRLLESAVDQAGILHPFAQATSIFITPGYQFRVVDALMTNFHLPKSTLFMLVSAFAGLERMKSAYDNALAAGYRFYSYGDTSLLEKA